MARHSARGRGSPPPIFAFSSARSSSRFTSRHRARIADSVKCAARRCWYKFDEHSRSAQTDPGAVALYSVALATLDDDPGVRPDAHAFIVDKAPWFTVTDDLPQYPARIPGQNAPHDS